MRILIICPHMPPVNAADMHRVRQDLNYFKSNNCDVTIISVEEEYIDFSRDEYLVNTVPESIELIKVKAIRSKWAKFFGFSSIAIRAYYNYYKKMDYLLKTRKYDIIFFSTTMFPLFTLGPIFKKKYGVPFVVDMQDPWVSNYYDNLPYSKRPPKYFIASIIDRLLERYTMNYVDGIVSVSGDYIIDLKQRYKKLKDVSSIVMTFSAPEFDIEIFNKIKLDLEQENDSLIDSTKTNITYVGRAGVDMELTINWFFKSLRELLDEKKINNNIKVNFIGTSYDPSGAAKKMVNPIAAKYNLQDIVFEQTDRVSYFRALNYINNSDVIFIPGSDDASYTASKIFPYILLKKPLIAVFHEDSSVCNVLEEIAYPGLVKFNKHSNIGYVINNIKSELDRSINRKLVNVEYNVELFDKYTSKNMTNKLVEFFLQVIDANSKDN